jgi:hypothetical protein
MHQSLPTVDQSEVATLFTIRELADRHPRLLNISRLRWAARNRVSNGAAAVFYESRGGELLINEPLFLEWFLGRRGKNKPRVLAR